MGHRRFGWLGFVLGALACGVVHGAPRVASIPGLPAAHCRPPAGARPWLDAHQSPQCRALEVIAALDPKELAHFDAGEFGTFSSPGPALSRKLGLPRLGGGHDGPNGIASLAQLFGVPVPPISRHVTAFPDIVTLAATWDRGLARHFGEALGEEFRGKGVTADFGPNLNIVRTWHDGRSAESFGEDPYLTSALGVEEVLGLQSRGVIATIKHFDANDQEFGRIGRYPNMAGIDEHIALKALEEIYLPQFKAAIQQGHAGAVMCAYDQVNGAFSCDNASLLRHLRRWGFDGVVVPDATFAERSPVAAARAGMDSAGPVAPLLAAVRRGILGPHFFARRVYHELVVRFRLGLYAHPGHGRPGAKVSTPAHRALAFQIATAGAVLLKNSGHLLPLGAQRSIAVLGADAGPQAVVMETGSAHVHVAHLSVPLEAIRTRAGAAVHVAYARADLGVRPLPLLPAAVLAPPSGRGHGLQGVYYATPDYWAPVLTRVDPTIDFGADPHIPHAPPGTLAKRQYAHVPTPWSAKWTGTLTPPTSGLYGFSLTGSGTAELYLNGRLVTAIEQADFPRTVIGTARLTKGRPVRLLIEYDTAAALLGTGVRVGWQPPNGRLARAVALARRAQVAIVFAGEQLGEGYDKIHFALPGDENRLIEAVAAANPHTVVVLNTSTPVAMPWIHRVAAVIEAWYPGAEDGTSIAALLYGDVNPSGRLPVTFPRTARQGPATHWWEYPGNGHDVAFDEGVRVGYRWYEAEHQSPLFPFGYGLSYTTFRIGHLAVIGRGAQRTVSVRVKNTGRRAGSDVVELYVGLPPAAADPPRQLKGFAKLFLKPGQSRTVRLALPNSALKAYDVAARRWRLYPGRYRIEVGASSRDIRASSRFRVSAGTSP